MTKSSIDEQELLDQLSWVRTLAQQVVGDPSVADDLTQDAMLVALTTNGVRPASMRHWLAAVVRNLGRSSRRSSSRRSDREALSNHSTALPSTDEIVERAGAHRVLVEALMELGEPYRSTLLLRFFDELTPKQIATRLGISESTVATRTAEGIRRLREHFERTGEFTTRGWAPFIFSNWLTRFERPLEMSTTASLSGVIALAVQYKVAIVLVAILGIVMAVNQPDDPASVGIQAEEVASLTEVQTRVAVPVIEAYRKRVESSPTQPESKSTSRGFDDIPEHAGIVRPVSKQISGLVLDLDGLPLAGIEVSHTSPSFGMRFVGEPVEFEPGESLTTDANGRFQLEAVPPAIFTVENEEWVTVYEGFFDGTNSNEDPIVFVGPRIDFGGVVVDELGQPIQTAVATIHPKGRVLRTSEFNLDSSVLVRPKAQCDERGEFRFEGLADFGASLLHVAAFGYEPFRGEFRAGGAANMQIELKSIVSSRYSIVGHVIEADGAVSVNTMVSIGTISVRTNEDGAFALDFEASLGWTSFDEPLQLMAVRSGALPGKLMLPSINDSKLSGWPEDIVLELGGAPLSIRGRVVDEHNRPLANISVLSPDMTYFGLEMDPGAAWGFERRLEEIASGVSSVQTDLNGEFEFAGLEDHSYRLHLIESGSLLSFVTEPIHPGANREEIIFERTALGTIAGRIVGRDGAGIAGVTVAVSLKRPTSLDIGRSSVTDEDGQFTLKRVTLEPEFLRLTGKPIVSELFRTLPEEADLEALELEVSRLCNFQVEWGASSSRVSEVFLVGDNDAPLDMVNTEGNGIGIRQSLAGTTGLSPVVGISDKTVEAIVKRQGVEVERYPVYPLPGELVILRL